MLGIYDGTEDLEEQRKKLGIKKNSQVGADSPRLQAISNAYDEGGFSSGAGVALRNLPGATLDTVKKLPIVRGLGALSSEAKEFTKAVVSGKATPSEPGVQSLSSITPKALTRGSVIDHGRSTNMPEGGLIAPVIAPEINEPVNALRDTELGAMTSSAVRLPDGGQRNTLRIGGNTLSYDVDKDGSRNGSDRNLAMNPNRSIRGLQQLGNGLDVTFDKSIPQDKRQGFVANSSGEMSEDEKQRRGLQRKQFLGRQLREIKNPEDPNMGWKERKANKDRILKDQQYNRTLSAERELAADTNAIATEHNRILEEGNVMQENRLSQPTYQKPESMKLNEYDPISGNVIGQRIVKQDAQGNWPNQQRTSNPTAATIAKMKSLKGDPKAEAQYRARFGSLPY